MDRAAAGAVDQGQRQAAMDRAQRIEQMRPRHAFEHRAALLDLDQPEAHRLADRRRRQLAGDHRAEHLEAGQARDLLERADAVRLIDPIPSIKFRNATNMAPPQVNRVLAFAGRAA